MAEKLQELLEKINSEGVQQAHAKAKEIESAAKKEADNILKDAKAAAEKIITDANKKAKKTKTATETALKQASRDLILSLKEEIKKIFKKIVTVEAAASMSPEDISNILGDLIKAYVTKGGESSDVTVLLKKEDLKKVKETFIAKLQNKLKEGIEFKPSQNIVAGFSISFDKGKSFFDFTQEGLTEALCAYLNPEVATLLKG
ncbi:MAG: hypothetical protein HQ593_04230 [Candidatus Omnitrophica bacterium]|nr:hypothetical protein [Candidatus Omnitrophota bacterium]